MRILLVNDWVAEEGGTETYLLGLRDSLRAEGDEVRLMTSSAGSAADGSADFVAYGARSVLPQIPLQVSNPFAAARARAAVRAFRPDVAHISMFELHLSPAVVAALRPTPIVLNISYYKPICPTGRKLWPDGTLCAEPAGLVCWRRSGCLSLPHWLRDRPRYALIRRALERADGILTCSAWMRERLAAEGVEAEHLDWPVSPPEREYRRARAPEPLFVYTGRLSPAKGVDLLLRAFARLRTTAPTAQLRIVGDGPDRAALENLAAALGLEGLTFKGWVARQLVERELADAWALVAPSLWAEPFGLVAAEAILRDIPVLASATGGFAETVEPGVTGLLFPNGDEDALVEALEEVARGQAFPASALPAESVERIRARHDPARHVERLRTVFAGVAGRAPTTA